MLAVRSVALNVERRRAELVESRPCPGPALLGVYCDELAGVDVWAIAEEGMTSLPDRSGMGRVMSPVTSPETKVPGQWRQMRADRRPAGGEYLAAGRPGYSEDQLC